jgi:hypothetical protein
MNKAPVCQRNIYLNTGRKICGILRVIMESMYPYRIKIKKI